ncbi:MAG: putative transposable element tc3 transposase, partial [Streblomastix strix]
MQRRQELLEKDFTLRKSACQELLNKQRESRSFENRIIWTDQCSFELGGSVNTHNCYYQSKINPHYYFDVPHLRAKQMVWCGICSKGIFGPYFVDDIVDQDVYKKIICDKLLPDLHIQFGSLRNLYFQQDGAPSHTANQSKDFLEELFENRTIGKGLAYQWPPRSPDLTPPDFWLWGSVKDIIYYPRPSNIFELRHAISGAIKSISEATCKNVCRAAFTRMQTCVDLEGGN